MEKRSRRTNQQEYRHNRTWHFGTNGGENSYSFWNEGFLYRVNDPSNGSYFMDDLCKKMIKEIWELFIKDK